MYYMITFQGLPLLCCKGAHRKLERAQWNSHSNKVFSIRQQELDNEMKASNVSSSNCIEEDEDLTPRFSVTIGQVRMKIIVGFIHLVI